MGQEVFMGKQSWPMCDRYLSSSSVKVLEEVSSF